MCWHVEYTLRPSPATVRDARLFASSELGRVLPNSNRDTVHDATLIVSELVANAMQAGSPTVVARLELHRHTLQVSILDYAPGWPALPTPSLTSGRGRGLLLVSEIATHWGVTGVQKGKKVWADLALSDDAALSVPCVHEVAS